MVICSTLPTNKTTTTSSNEVIKENKAPEITRDRLYIETMENVLGKISHKVIVDPNLENFLPLMKIESKGVN